MPEWLCVLFLLAGSLLMLTAGISLIRLPDIYTRMHASTKAPALGILFFLTAATLHFNSWQVFLKSLFIIAFIFLTVPIASHMIGRAAHMSKSSRYTEDMRDDLQSARDRLHDGGNAERAGTE